jgi:hypothetical protein
MWFLTIFVGFITSFYLGCWVLYKGIKKITQRDRLFHAIILFLLAIGLFILCRICFKSWYARLN